MPAKVFANIWNGENKECLFGKSPEGAIEILPNPCFVGWYGKLPAMCRKAAMKDTLFQRLIKALDKALEEDELLAGPGDILYEDHGLWAVWHEDVEHLAENYPARKLWSHMFVCYALTTDREPFETKLGTNYCEIGY